MKDFKIEGNTIILPSLPKKFKKITGTRFASILGLNPWQTAFQAWADITGFYKEPFEENIYTRAGKAIEPIIIRYLDKKYYFGKGKLKTPDEWFGKTVQQLQFDHFHDEPILGGMWDARTNDTIYELKTTKRVEDWYRNGKLEAPEYYKLQAALYAYLCKVDKFRMVLTMLTEKDYQSPESFLPDTKNTQLLTYSLSQEYPHFEDLTNSVIDWYEKYVITGKSPDFDNKSDADILKAVRKQVVVPGEEESPIDSIIKELEPLQVQIEKKNAETASIEEQVKQLKEKLKCELRSVMKPTDKKVQATGAVYDWELSLESGGFDSTKLKKEMPEIYEMFQKTTAKEVLRVKIKEAV